MACSAALRLNAPTTSSSSSSPRFSSKLWLLRFNRKHNKLAVVRAPNSKKHLVRSVLGDKKLNLGNSGKGATDPVEFIVERLFERAQKVEEQRNSNPSISECIQVGFDLEVLESSLQVALEALRKKEEDLKDAEGIVLLEHGQVNHAKQKLEQQEEEIAVGHGRQEKIEDDLKLVNQDLASQVKLIEDLKLAVKDRDHEITAVKSALCFREKELDQMRYKLMEKTDDSAMIVCALESKNQYLHEATGILKKQEVEIRELQEEVSRKGQELEESAKLRMIEKDKLKAAEAKLEKQTVEWLLAQEELKQMAEAADRHMGETSETLEELKRVRKMLIAVRSELVSSQQSLAASRSKVEEQEVRLESQLRELEEQKFAMISHMKSLKDAEVEVESEKAKLRVTEARNRELEQELSIEKVLVKQIQEELRKERTSLEQASKEIAELQSDLHHRTSQFIEAQNLLQLKESHLVEARLEIQHLKSKHASLQFLLEEKNTVAFDAQQKWLGLNYQVAQLKELLSEKEDQFIEAAKKLQEKEDHILAMWHELNDSNLKFSEVATVVERMTELTNNLVISVNDEHCDTSDLLVEEIQLPVIEHELEKQKLKKPMVKFSLHDHHLETELKVTRDSLRVKEMEVVASQMAPTVKDEEMKTILNGLDEKDKELMKMKHGMVEDANGLKERYKVGEEKNGDKNLGNLANEILRLESVEKEVEAATTALRNLADMTRELLKKADLGPDTSINDVVFPQFDRMPLIISDGRDDYVLQAHREVAGLAALTEQLAKEAGICVSTNL